MLLAAGMYTTEPHRFMGYQILAGLGLPILWVLGSPAPAAIVAAGAVGIAAAGFWAPMLVVSRRGRSRLELVEYELPELVDLLVVTLEAGVSFAGSMQLAADRVQGPLGEELRLALQEQRMGLSVTEALRNMMQRADTPSVRSFVRSDSAGRAAGCLDRPDHAQPRRRDAQAPACGGRGTRSEGPREAALPTDLSDVSGDVRDPARAGGVQICRVVSRLGIVFTLRRAERGLLCQDCLLASSFMTRLRGLMGRKQMDPTEGLMLRTSSVHTSFMRFPIDVVFLDKQLNVLRIVPALRPWRAAACRRASWALELPANTCVARPACRRVALCRAGGGAPIERQSDRTLFRAAG